ncbi:hypothetical protein ACP70R_029036 [Stipagrostis hirtigluma subsp. patula]
MDSGLSILKEKANHADTTFWAYWTLATRMTLGLVLGDYNNSERIAQLERRIDSSKTGGSNKHKTAKPSGPVFPMVLVSCSSKCNLWDGLSDDICDTFLLQMKW